MGLGLVTEADGGDCRVDLILRILSWKNLQKVSARSIFILFPTKYIDQKSSNPPQHFL